MGTRGGNIDPRSSSSEATIDRKERDIASEGSRTRVWVIPTNEELLIARDTVRCVKDAPLRW